jgi:hypothetical protein
LRVKPFSERFTVMNFTYMFICNKMQKFLSSVETLLASGGDQGQHLWTLLGLAYKTTFSFLGGSYSVATSWPQA